jgi:tRNA/rRNA methyltransferase
VTVLDRIRVVLVEPRDAGNVGAAARAMKNMGLRTLVVAGGVPLDERRAATMAVHADDVLHARRTAPDLATAVADAGWVIGTCGRATAARDGGRPPREVAAEIVAAAGRNDVALVFGPEDRGLSKIELDQCQAMITIPTDAAYSSLNLAQSVLLCGYEIFLAAGGATPEPARVLASSARTELMHAKLEAALLAVGFLQPDTAASMMRKLRRTLGRAALDDDEVQVLLGIARQMSWAAGQRRRS